MLATAGSCLFGLIGVLRPPRQILVVVWTLAGGLPEFPGVSDEPPPHVTAHRFDCHACEPPPAFVAAPVRIAAVIEMRELGAVAAVRTDRRVQIQRHTTRQWCGTAFYGLSSVRGSSHSVASLESSVGGPTLLSFAAESSRQIRKRERAWFATAPMRASPVLVRSLTVRGSQSNPRMSCSADANFKI